MLTTKLILVDGLPGSGKSSTAQFITLQLQNHHLAACWYYEDEEPHPIHFWEAESRGDFVRRNLNAWQTFAASDRSSEGITVLESTIFQRTAGALLAQYDGINAAWLEAYYRDIQAAIADLEPVMIHLYPDDSADFMRQTFADRGEGWTQMIVDFVTQSPLSIHRNWVGVEGAIAFFTHYRQLCDHLFDSFTMPKIALDITGGDWPRYYQQIMDLIGLPLVDVEVGLNRDLEQFAGRYRDRDSDFECLVRFHGGQLMVNQVWWPADNFTALIPKSADHFLVRGAPVGILFKRPKGTQKYQMHITGHWGEHIGKTLQQS